MSFHSSLYVYDVDSLIRFSIFSYSTILPIEDVIRLPVKEFDSQWMQHSSSHHQSPLLRGLDSSYPEHWYRHASRDASALRISLLNLFQTVSPRFKHTQCHNDCGEEGRKRKEIVGSVRGLRNEHRRDQCDEVIRELHLLASFMSPKDFSYIPNWHSEQGWTRCSWSFWASSQSKRFGSQLPKFR